MAEYTKGAVILELSKLYCLLHVIKDEFCAGFDSIIGLDMLQKHKGLLDLAKMNLFLGPYVFPFLNKEKFVIEPNTSQGIYVHVANPSVSDGYIPEIDIHPNLCIEDALATNRDGLAYIKCFNLSEETIEFEAPTIELEPYEIVSRSKY